VHKEAPGFRPGPRETETRFHVYMEAPGFRPGPQPVMWRAMSGGPYPWWARAAWWRRAAARGVPCSRSTSWQGVTTRVQTAYGVRARALQVDTITTRVQTAYGVRARALQVDTITTRVQTAYGVRARALQVDTITTRVQTAYGVCNQRLKQYDEPVSNFIFYNFK